MAYKWIQCRFCGETKHIEAFPEEERHRQVHSPIGACSGCIRRGAGQPTLITTFGTPFVEYLEARHGVASQ